MARLSIEPPKSFNFSNPDDWLRWTKRFQQFREASGLSTESQTRQVSTLLYCLGEDADIMGGGAEKLQYSRRKI